MKQKLSDELVKFFFEFSSHFGYILSSDVLFETQVGMKKKI